MNEAENCTCIVVNEQQQQKITNEFFRQNDE